MNNFSEISLRLKQELRVSSDKEAAALLKLSNTAWANRKKREAFPESELRSLSHSRPEVDVEYVLTGKRSKAHILAKVAKAGERVRQVREEAGLSIAEFAKEVGAKVAYIESVEAAEAWFANDLLSPIIEKFCVSPMWLLSGDVPVFQEGLSPFESFVLERYRACSPTQRTKMREFSAELLAAANESTTVTKRTKK